MAKPKLEEKVFIPHGIREEIYRIAKAAGETDDWLVLQFLLRSGIDAFRRDGNLPVEGFNEWRDKIFNEHFKPVDSPPS